MTRRSTPVLPLIALTALLATGLAGCKKGPEEGAAEAQKNASAPGQTTQAAQGQTQAQPAQPGSQGSQTGLPASGMPPMMSSQQEQKPVDTAQLPDVVARINGQEIKKAELVQEAAQMRQQLAQMQGVQAPLNAGFYKQVLDGIVARTLLQQEAKADKLTLSEAEVNQQLAALKSQAPSPEAFQKALAANKLTEESLRQKIRSEGTVQKLVQTKVLAKVTVSDQQIKEFYDKNPDRMKKPERLHLRQLVVEADAKAPADERQKAKAKADDFLKRAQGGEDFTKLSTSDPKVHGGDAWLTRGQAPPLLENAAFALTKPNQLSPVLESPVGYHILQLIERQPSEVAPYDTVKGQIAEFLKQQQSQAALAAHVQELKAKGKVETYL